MADILANPTKVVTTIALGAGTSGVVDLNGFSLFAIETPNTLTGGTITFRAGTAAQGTTAVGNFRPVYDSANNQLSMIVGTNQMHTDIPELAPLRYVQLVMGTQAAAADFTVLMK